MVFERFELDLMPRPVNEKHGLILHDLIASTIREYRAEHPKVCKQDIQNAVQHIEDDFLSESNTQNECSSEPAEGSDSGRRFMDMIGILFLLSSIAMIAAMMFIRRP